MCGVRGRFGLHSNDNTSRVLVQYCLADRAVNRFDCKRTAPGVLGYCTQVIDD